MFLKKDNYNFVQNDEDVKETSHLTDIQTTANLTNAANRLLEFRVFAIKNGHTYLSRIIEPVVKEILNLAHQLDAHYAPDGLIEKHDLHEAAEGSNIDLTASELACLKWCSVGKTDKEIALELGIQESTVIFQMKSARQKLNTNTDAHSIAKIIRLKLI